MSARAKRSVPKVVSIRSAQQEPEVATVLGTVVSWAGAEGLRVDYVGNGAGPLHALTLVALSAAELDELVASRRPVVLTLTKDGQAVLLGIVQSVPVGRGVERSAPATEPTPTRALVDGKEVVLEAEERVELRCGKASIVLTKAGKVLIQGTYISSRSSGAHRIRGGSVEVN